MHLQFCYFQYRWALLWVPDVVLHWMFIPFMLYYYRWWLKRDFVNHAKQIGPAFFHLLCTLVLLLACSHLTWISRTGSVKNCNSGTHSGGNDWIIVGKKPVYPNHPFRNFWHFVFAFRTLINVVPPPHCLMPWKVVNFEPVLKFLGINSPLLPLPLPLPPPKYIRRKPKKKCIRKWRNFEGKTWTYEHRLPLIMSW